MNLLMDVLTYSMIFTSIIIVIRYRNYIDWFYIYFLIGMVGGGSASIESHYLLGMIICDIFAVIAIFFAIQQARERISRKTVL